jgi:hypothetical protein
MIATAVLLCAIDVITLNEKPPGKCRAAFR